jgi:drug/metabolite transporter (DMT)-like permease
MRWLTNHGYVLMILTALVWSGNAIVGRAVHEIVPPFGLAFWRWAATLPVVVIIAWPYLRRDFPAMLAGWRWMLFLAGLGIALYNSVIYLGLDHTTAINMVLINSARPAMIVALSFVVFRERVSSTQTVGLVLGFLGTLVVLFHGELERLATLELNIGDMFIFVATISWALYTVFFPKRPPIHGASFMAYSVAIGVILLLPFYVWETATVESVPFVWETIAAVLFLSLGASVIGHMGYNRIVELLGANIAGVTSYLVMAFGVVIAIIALGEAFHGYHAGGLALLLLGTYLATRKEAKAK